MNEEVVAGLLGSLAGAIGAVARVEIFDYPGVLDVLVLGFLDVDLFEGLQYLVGGPLGFVVIVEGILIGVAAAAVMAIGSKRKAVSRRALWVGAMVLVVQVLGSLRLNIPL